MKPSNQSTATKEQVRSMRDAKRAAKQATKHKIQDSARHINEPPPAQSPPPPLPIVVTAKSNELVAATTVPAAAAGPAVEVVPNKSREDILAERELKKQAKIAGKQKKLTTEVIEKVLPAATAALVGARIDEPSVAFPTKVLLSKSERRAKQEAQRLAKSKTTTTTKPAANTQIDIAKAPTPKSGPVSSKSVVTLPITTKKLPNATRTDVHRVKLFNHLYADRELPKNVLNSINIHPSVIKLGAQYANRIVVGSNARCIAFMNTLKMIILEYKTPPQKEFSRGLEAIIQPCVAYLHQCRPLSVSITNALKFIKWQLTHLPNDESDVELKQRMLELVDTYIRDQIEKAAQAISISVQQKISNGDVILTFGCSSLINHILDEAKKRTVDFRVIVVDARPDHEGQEMLRRLVALNIRCTCVLINAVGFIMPEVTKVLLGAHALMANGYVMSRAGTAQVAMVAKAYNVPVLVCCETHKFSERVQTDAFVYNEIGDPDQLVLKTTSNTSRHSKSLANWEALSHITPLNLCYDITPPELVTAVVTELAILPCTSVPVILRIQPS